MTDAPPRPARHHRLHHGPADAGRHRPTGHAGRRRRVRQLHLWTGGDVLRFDDLYLRPGHRDAGAGRQLMADLAATN